MGRKSIKGVSYPDLSEFTVTVGTADVYSFRFKEPFGWAIFTVNNATGEFHIQSDWGNWQYRWAVGKNLGERSAAHEKPLSHFLATGSGSGYVVDKLSYNEPRSFQQEFSEKRTKDAMRRMILSARLKHHDVPASVSEWMGARIKANTKQELEYWYGDALTYEEARQLWKDLDRWLDEDDLRTEAAQLMAIDNMRYSYPELYDFLTEKDESRNSIEREIWELFEYEPSWPFVFLREVLLPFFFKYLREKVIGDPDAEAEKKTT